ncbi:uncharacterized protein EI90DRAFT_3045932 [Cantharellus anzutake]|uniref:uncharacterized protein n=1 Tax=Cantharellus anzutake TaxID=1750568 RepID=UPI001902DCBA|nr:uncharacterized protein EI90DRAFT_3045932 [Cantharellus anzutake]KAF8336485.1 hypothetical protein EI90DRAFT_3045932 [Cantharellus anzutake]
MVGDYMAILTAVVFFSLSFFLPVPGIGECPLDVPYSFSFKHTYHTHQLARHGFITVKLILCNVQNRAERTGRLQ